MLGVKSGLLRRCREIAVTLGADAWSDYAPPSAGTKALVITQPVSLGPEYQTGGPVTEQVTFGLNWYDETEEECWEGLHEIEKSLSTLPRPALDRGCSCLAVRLGGQTVMEDPQNAPNGSTIWHGTMRLTLLVQRTLTD